MHPNDVAYVEAGLWILSRKIARFRGELVNASNWDTVRDEWKPVMKEARFLSKNMCSRFQW